MFQVQLSYIVSALPENRGEPPIPSSKYWTLVKMLILILVAGFVSGYMTHLSLVDH